MRISASAVSTDGLTVKSFGAPEEKADADDSDPPSPPRDRALSGTGAKLPHLSGAVQIGLRRGGDQRVGPAWGIGCPAANDGGRHADRRRRRGDSPVHRDGGLDEGVQAASRRPPSGHRVSIPGRFSRTGVPRYLHLQRGSVTDTTICRFPRRQFDGFIKTRPAMERRLLAMASNELAAAQDQMVVLGRKTAQERVASFLLGLIRRQERLGRDGKAIRLTMTRSDIADYLGLTTETVSRTFTNLRADGFIELDGTTLVRALDREALRHIAEGAA